MAPSMVAAKEPPPSPSPVGGPRARGDRRLHHRRGPFTWRARRAPTGTRGDRASASRAGATFASGPMETREAAAVGANRRPPVPPPPESIRPALAPTLRSAKLVVFRAISGKRSRDGLFVESRRAESFLNAPSVTSSSSTMNATTRMKTMKE